MTKQKPCDVETLDDFGRYYGQLGKQAFGYLHPEYGCTVPAKYMGGGKSGGDMIIGPLRQLEKGKFAWDDSKIIRVKWDTFKKYADFGIPKVGMVQVGGELAYGAIAGERNSNRGLNLERVKFYDFSHWHLREKYGPSLPWFDFQDSILWQVFTRPYVRLAEAHRMLSNGEAVGVPIHPNFGLYTLPDRSFPSLAYKRWTIGYMSSPDDVRLYPEFYAYSPYVQSELFGVQPYVSE